MQIQFRVTELNGRYRIEGTDRDGRWTPETEDGAYRFRSKAKAEAEMEVLRQEICEGHLAPLATTYQSGGFAYDLD